MDREDIVRSHNKAISEMAKKQNLELAAYSKKIE